MSDLTYQIAEKLRETYDETIGTLDEKVGGTLLINYIYFIEHFNLTIMQ